MTAAGRLYGSTVTCPVPRDGEGCNYAAVVEFPRALIHETGTGGTKPFIREAGT
jgi:hypothetical protein